MKKKLFYADVILLLFLTAGIQPALATITLSVDGWSPPEVGIWDPDTKTATLTTDVSETIIILNPWFKEISENDRITLVGGGHTIGGIASGTGVDLADSLYVTIQNLNVTGCAAGITLNPSGYCNVINITISDCQKGIFMWEAGTCLIEGNTVSMCDTGILIQNVSRFNTLKNNTVKNNNIGISITDTSHDNTIYNNNFINNDLQQATVYNDFNLFNLSAEEGGGNYWDDWTEPDFVEPFGFVDNPYLIPYGQDKDYLPWTLPDGWLTPVNQPPVPDAGPDQIVEQDSFAGASVTLDGSGSSDDGQIQPLTYTWTWAGGGSSMGVNPTVTLPLGTTTVTLTAYDGQLSDTDTVDITVQSAESPEDAVEYIRDYIENMDVPEDAGKEMAKAVKDLNKAIDAFNNDRIDKALNEIAKAVKQLMKAQNEGADTQSVIDELVDLVQGIAEEAIEDAIATVGADNLHVVKAQEHYDTALGNLADGKYDAAIKRFKNAYREAMKVLGE